MCFFTWLYMCSLKKNLNFVNSDSHSSHWFLRKHSHGLYSYHSVLFFMHLISTLLLVCLDAWVQICSFFFFFFKSKVNLPKWRPQYCLYMKWYLGWYFYFLFRSRTNILLYTFSILQVKTYNAVMGSGMVFLVAKYPVISGGFSWILEIVLTFVAQMTVGFIKWQFQPIKISHSFEFLFFPFSISVCLRKASILEYDSFGVLFFLWKPKQNASEHHSPERKL